MGTIISITTFKRRKCLTRYIDLVINGGLVANSPLLTDYPEMFKGVAKEKHSALAYGLEQKSILFNQQLQQLKRSLHTNNYQFKFPGITNLYKNLNPVLCLFNETERLLLVGNRKDVRLKWIKSLFKNKSWKQLLLLSIDKDVLEIERFVRTHNVNSLNEQELMLINHLRVRLLNARRLFSTLR